MKIKNAITLTSYIRVIWVDEDKTQIGLAYSVRSHAVCSTSSSARAHVTAASVVGIRLHGTIAWHVPPINWTISFRSPPAWQLSSHYMRFSTSELYCIWLIVQVCCWWRVSTYHFSFNMSHVHLVPVPNCVYLSVVFSVSTCSWPWFGRDLVPGKAMTKLSLLTFDFRPVLSGIRIQFTCIVAPRWPWCFYLRHFN